MKRFLKISLLLITAVLLILGGGALYFSKQIKPIIQQKLNEQLQVKVEVKEIKLTSLTNFPKLGVRFEQVVIHESQKYYGEPSLEADELNLYIDLFKLLKKEYTVDAVHISNAHIRLADLENGNNYDIFSSDSSTSEPLNFEIEDIKLTNSNISYRHIPSTFISQLNATELNANLKYQDANIKMKLKGALVADSITHNNDYYLYGQELKINSEFILSNNNSLLSISPSNLWVEEVDLETSGLVKIDDDNTFIDIKFKNQKAPISKIITILPDYLQESFNHLKAEGNANLDAFFKGNISKDKNPSFGLEFALDETTLSPHNLELKLSNIKTSGKLLIPNLGNMNTAYVQAVINKAKSGKNSISGDLRVENFNDPLIKWAGDAQLDAPTISALLDMDNITVSKGQIGVQGNFELRYLVSKAMVQPNSFKFIGNFKGSDLKMRWSDPDIDVKSLDFDVKANDKHMIIRSCQAKYNNTNAELTGVLRDADQLFNKASSTELSGKLKINELNINDFFSSDSSDYKEAEIVKELLPIRLALQAEIQGFKYNNFYASEVVGTLVSNKKKVVLRNTKMKALQGNADAEIVFTTLGDNYLLDINSHLYSINVTQLFEQFDNFEQDEITSDHLSGTLSGDLLAKVMFNANFEPLLDKLYAKSNMEVLNGQLTGYEPLLELSSFVEVEDLKNVSFSSLKNTIEIFDQTVFIPKMHIGNSAMNLDLEGTHNFENYMNYNISLSLGEILAKRSNWFAKKYERNMKDNERGGLTANIHMEGTPEDLSITYDRVTVSKVVNEELKEEKKKFINALKGQSSDGEKPDDYYEDIWDE